MKRQTNSRKKKKETFLNFVGLPKGQYLGYIAPTTEELPSYQSIAPVTDDGSGTTSSGTSTYTGNVSSVLMYSYGDVDNASSCKEITDMIAKQGEAMALIRYTSEQYAVLQAWFTYAYARQAVLCATPTPTEPDPCADGSCNVFYPKDPVVADPIFVQPIGAGTGEGDSQTIGAGTSEGDASAGSSGGILQTITDALSGTTTTPKSTPYSGAGGFGTGFGGGGGGGGDTDTPASKWRNWFWIVVGALAVTGYVLKGSEE